MLRLENLPIGAKIKFGKHVRTNETPWDIVWLLVGWDQSNPVFITEKVIDIRAFDGKEPGHPEVEGSYKSMGNSNYSYSNIHQWLNSSDTNWWKATHEFDTPPDSRYIEGGSEYADRPGFLSNFSEEEKSLLCEHNALCYRYYSDSGNVVYDGYDAFGKVFLPSIKELNVGGKYSDECWEYFRDKTANAFPTAQLGSASVNTSNYYRYLTRDAYGNEDGWVCRVANNEGQTYIANISCKNSIESGVRPVIELDFWRTLSDTVDSDGCYRILPNESPSAPILTVPETIYSGQTITLRWTPSVDPEGTPVRYSLNTWVDDEGASSIHGITSTEFAYTVPSDAIRVRFAVDAYDSDLVSPTSSNTVERTIIHGDPPVISPEDAHIGTKSAAFTKQYSVTNPYNEKMTITESIDGKVLNTFYPTEDYTGAVAVDGETWLKLTNGTHTIVIAATNRITTIIRTYTFEKKVSTLSVRSEPMISSSRPIRISLRVLKDAPPEADVSVMVCNNANDVEPTWETAVQSSVGTYTHVFENESKTAEDWAVAVFVSISRNGGEGNCYISSIGGAFE